MLVIYFCSFDLFCPLLEKDSFIFIVVYCIVVSLNSALFKPCLFQSRAPVLFCFTNAQLNVFLKIIFLFYFDIGFPV